MPVGILPFFRLYHTSFFSFCLILLSVFYTYSIFPSYVFSMLDPIQESFYGPQQAANPFRTHSDTRYKNLKLPWPHNL